MTSWTTPIGGGGGRKREQPTVRAIFLDDLISNTIQLYGRWEATELDLLSRVVFSRLPKSSTAIDVGANIGNHANHFARHFDRVLAFEPDPMIAHVLSANAIYQSRMAGENQERVQVFPYALREQAGQCGYRVHDDHNLGGSGIVDDDDASFQIEIKTLDSVISDLGVTDVTFIKCDVEGWEGQVFAGARELLTQSDPIIAFEASFGIDLPAQERGQFVEELLLLLNYSYFFEPTPRLTLQRIPTLVGTDRPMVIVSKFDLN